MSETQPEMAQLAIHKGPDAEIERAGLRFVACRREIEGIDGGITLRVLHGETAGDAEGPRELLRFDCFRARPHYHAPGEAQAESSMELDDPGQARDWVFERLSTDARGLLIQGGFEDLAASLDVDALRDLGARLGELFETLEEPNETSYFEIEAAMLARATGAGRDGGA